jgi:hypothetical protein
MSARLAARWRADGDQARHAFRASLDTGRVADAVEIAVGAAFLWRNAIGCTEGGQWVDELLSTEPSPADRMWTLILLADLGQGIGDYRQVLAAAAQAREIDDGSDLAASCIIAHYDSLTRPNYSAPRSAAGSTARPTTCSIGSSSSRWCGASTIQHPMPRRSNAAASAPRPKCFGHGASHEALAEVGKDAGVASAWNDLELTPAPDQPGRFTATISDAWMLVAVAQGGFVAALAARAMRQTLDAADQQLRSLSAVFAGQVAPGPSRSRSPCCDAVARCRSSPRPSATRTHPRD